MRALNRYQQSKLDAAFRRSFREDARRTQKDFCAYCEERLTAKTVTADHIRPRHSFGLDHRNNIVAACEPCNKLKGYMPEPQYRKLIEKPLSGAPFAVWMAWSRLRINRRLRLMEKRLGVAA